MQRGDGWLQNVTCGKEDLEAGLGCTQPQSPLSILHPRHCPPFPSSSWRRELWFLLVYFWHKRHNCLTSEQSEVGHHLWLNHTCLMYSALYFPSILPGAFAAHGLCLSTSPLSLQFCILSPFKCLLPALFVARTRRQPRCPYGRRMDKKAVEYYNTMEYYSAVEKNAK